MLDQTHYGCSFFQRNTDDFRRWNGIQDFADMSRDETIATTLTQYSRVWQSCKRNIFKKKYLNVKKKNLFVIVVEIQNTHISLLELRSHNTQLIYCLMCAFAFSRRNVSNILLDSLFHFALRNIH